MSPGEAGEIAIKRPDPVMFLEYWQKAGSNAREVHRRLDDDRRQGVVDEEGYVQFVGRDDDVITSSGYRIGPAEIEDC